MKNKKIKYLSKAKRLVILSASLLSSSLIATTACATTIKNTSNTSSSKLSNKSRNVENTIYKDVGPLRIAYTLYDDGTCEIGNDQKQEAISVSKKTFKFKNQSETNEDVPATPVCYNGSTTQERRIVTSDGANAYEEYTDYVKNGQIDETLAPGATIKIPGIVENNNKIYPLTKIRSGASQSLFHKSKVAFGFTPYNDRTTQKHSFPEAYTYGSYSWQLDFSECYYLEEIESEAFTNCLSISSLVFKNNVNLRKIGKNAFTYLTLGCPAFSPLESFFFSKQWLENCFLNEYAGPAFKEYIHTYCGFLDDGEGSQKRLAKYPAKETILDFSASKLQDPDGPWFSTGYTATFSIYQINSVTNFDIVTIIRDVYWDADAKTVNNAMSDPDKNIKYVFFSHGSSEHLVEPKEGEVFKPICTINEILLPRTISKVPMIFGTKNLNTNNFTTEVNQRQCYEGKIDVIVCWASDTTIRAFWQPYCPQINRIDLQIADKESYKKKDFFLKDGSINAEDRLFLKHVKAFSVYAGDKTDFVNAVGEAGEENSLWPNDAGPAPGYSGGAEILESCFTGATSSYGSLSVNAKTNETVLDNTPWHFDAIKTDIDDRIKFSCFDIIPAKPNKYWNDIINNKNLNVSKVTIGKDEWDYNYFIKVLNISQPGAYWFKVRAELYKNDYRYSFSPSQFIELNVSDGYIFSFGLSSIDIEVGTAGTASKRFSAYYNNEDVTEKIDWSLVDENEKEVTDIGITISNDGWISWDDKVKYKNDGYHLGVKGKRKDAYTSLPALDRVISLVDFNTISLEHFQIYGGSEHLYGYNEIGGKDELKWTLYCNGEKFKERSRYIFFIESENENIKVSSEGQVYWISNVGVGSTKFCVVAVIDPGTTAERVIRSNEITLDIEKMPKEYLTAYNGSTSITSYINTAGIDSKNWIVYVIDDKIDPEYVSYSIEPEIPGIYINKQGYVNWSNTLNTITTYEFVVKCSIKDTPYACYSPTIKFTVLDDVHSLAVNGGSITLKGNAGTAGKDNFNWKLYDHGVQVQDSYQFSVSPGIPGISVSNNGVISWSNELQKGKYKLKVQCAYAGRVVNSSDIELNIDDPLPSNGMNKTLLITLLTLSGVALVLLVTVVIIVVKNKKKINKKVA